MAKYNFNKDTKSNESTESTDIKATETQADAVELTDSALENSENVSETAKEKAEEKTEDVERLVGSVVLTYVGNGVWRDGKGKCWSRVDNKPANILSTRTLLVSEYEGREDLKFMVKYGEMKKTLV